MQRWYTVVSGLTIIAGCGSGAGGTRAVPTEPPLTIATPAIPIDATVAATPPPPRPTCPAGTAVIVAAAPEPTWACARADGVREGPFVTLYPDDTIEIEGAYHEGRLEGPWQRRAPSGTIVESGAYVAGRKHGRWRQLSATGTALGEYDMINGTGIERRWYETGVPYQELARKDGAADGVTRVFAADGAVLSTARYAAGMLDGAHVFGSRNTLRFEETFAHGVRRGARAIWRAGVLIAEERYDRRGRLDGPYVLWRRAGVPRARGQFKAGKRVGAWTWFDRNGNKERAGTYVDGARDGVWSEWFETNLISTGRYVADLADGVFVSYDRRGRELGRFTIARGTGTMLTFHTNGRPSSRTQVARGQRHGRYEELTPTGRVVVAGRYLRDARHGKWQAWTSDGVLVRDQAWRRGKLEGPTRKFVDGKLAMEATYVADRAVGPYLEFRDGQPAVKGEFRDDRKHGAWTTYAADGTVIATATYVDGILDGPWRQLVDGAVVEGTMTAGRRRGAWTRTQGGAVSTVTYPYP